MNLPGEPVGPDDIVAAARHAVATRAPAVDADWTVPADAVDWDVRSTVLHAVSCVTCYTIDLASQATSRVPLALDVPVHATNEQVLEVLGAAARMMAPWRRRRPRAHAHTTKAAWPTRPDSSPWRSTK